MATKLNWFDRMMLGITFAEADFMDKDVEMLAAGCNTGDNKIAGERHDCRLGEVAMGAQTVKV